MKMKIALSILLLAVFCPMGLMAAAPASNQPGYEPNIPWQFGSGSPTPLVPLPPHLPEYLPNGAINLDEVWIQDGGARLYWNTIVLPQELKMGGATWIDPALVPLLIPQQQTPVRRWRPRAKKPVKAPTTASLQTPGIPLPVTPVEPALETTPAPAKQAPVKRARRAKRAPQARVVTPAATSQVVAPPQTPVPPLTAPGYQAAPPGTPGIPIVQEDSSIAPPRLQ